MTLFLNIKISTLKFFFTNLLGISIAVCTPLAIAVLIVYAGWWYMGDYPGWWPLSLVFLLALEPFLLISLYFALFLSRKAFIILNYPLILISLSMSQFLLNVSALFPNGFFYNNFLFLITPFVITMIFYFLFFIFYFRNKFLTRLKYTTYKSLVVFFVFEVIFFAPFYFIWSQSISG